jgi:broad specificity phosphatase PhoE/ribonuclease HI
VSPKLIVEADGGSRGNPGPAGYGALVRDAGSGEIVAQTCDSLGHTTNNVAEYSGLIAGLQAARQLAAGADIEVRMDSRLVVEQMSGRWKIKDANLGKLAATAREVAAGLGQITYTWIPRAKNTAADRLANQAMDAAAAGRAPAAEAQENPRYSAISKLKSAVRPAEAAGSAPGWLPPSADPTVTLLLRHGETPLSVERRFAGRGDAPLTATGRRQAAAAAKRLAARGGIDAIISSPLQRARRTAELAAEATGAPLTVDEDLAETDFGELEGLTFAEASQRWPDETTAWLGSADVAPPGGESLATVARRVLGALDRLLAAHPRGTVVLVSHVTPIKTLACRAMLAPPATMFRIHLDVASLCEVHWYPDGPAMVRSLNDTSHLRARGR